MEIKEIFEEILGYVQDVESCSEEEKDTLEKRIELLQKVQEQEELGRLQSGRNKLSRKISTLKKETLGK